MQNNRNYELSYLYKPKDVVLNRNKTKYLSGKKNVNTELHNKSTYTKEKSDDYGGCGDGDRQCARLCHLSNKWHTGWCCHHAIPQSERKRTTHTLKSVYSIDSFIEEYEYKSNGDIYIPVSKIEKKHNRDHKESITTVMLEKSGKKLFDEFVNSGNRKGNLPNNKKQQNYDNYVKYYEEEQLKYSNSDESTIVIKAPVADFKDSEIEDSVRTCMMRSCMNVPLPPTSSDDDEHSKQKRLIEPVRQCGVIIEEIPVEPKPKVQPVFKNPVPHKAQPKAKFDIKMETGPVRINVLFRNVKDDQKLKEVQKNCPPVWMANRKPSPSESEEIFYDAKPFPTAHSERPRRRKRGTTGPKKPSIEETYEDYLQHTRPSTRHWQPPTSHPSNSFVKKVGYPITLIKDFVWGPTEQETHQFGPEALIPQEDDHPDFVQLLLEHDGCLCMVEECRTMFNLSNDSEV